MVQDLPYTDAPVRYILDVELVSINPECEFVAMKLSSVSLLVLGRFDVDFLKEDTYMPDLPSNLDANLDANSDTGVKPNRELPPGIPRWVKVFGIITLILILLVVIMIIFGGGNHGPGRHGQPSSVTEQSMQQP